MKNDNYHIFNQEELFFVNKSYFLLFTDVSIDHLLNKKRACNLSKYYNL